MGRSTIIAILLGISFTGCGQTRVDDRSYELMLQSILEEKVPFLSVDSLSRMERTDYVLLDTRSKEEFRVSRIPGAVWVGQEFDPEMLPDLSEGQKVVTYCSVGKRSEELGAKLASSYKGLEVLNLYGGIFEWVNQGGVVQNRKGEATDSVHAYNENWGVWLKKGEKVYRPKPSN